MNTQKKIDYSELFATLDIVIASNLPQIKLYLKIGCAVSNRPEKGAAIAAAEYLQTTYPDTVGFSPRNVRRMREFYQAYKDTPEILQQAMQIGWTQNVIIMEADLPIQEKFWYIQAVRQFSWSKAELVQQINSGAHLEITLDLAEEMCYTDKNSIQPEEPSNDKDIICVFGQHLPQSDGGVCDEGSGGESRLVETIPGRISRDQPGWWGGLSTSPEKTRRTWDQLQRKALSPTVKSRLRQIRPPDWDGLRQSPQYAPYLRRRSREQNVSASGLYRLPQRHRRPLVYRRFRHSLERCEKGLSWFVEVS